MRIIRRARLVWAAVTFWRHRIAEVAGWSLMLFVVLPFIVKGLGGDFTVGVLMGTGVVLVWYTIETAGLRNAPADQSGLALEQIKIASAQYQVALQQVDAAISPLLVSRLELADG